MIRCYNCIHNGVCHAQEVCNDIEEQLDEFGCNYYADASMYFRPKADIGDADVVEVVRCKNCKYRTSECEPEHGRTQHYCTKNKISVKRDFFCGYGKRKE